MIMAFTQILLMGFIHHRSPSLGNPSPSPFAGKPFDPGRRPGEGSNGGERGDGDVGWETAGSMDWF